MVLKELILTVSTLGRKWWSSKTDFNSFYFGDEVMLSKELILTVSTLAGGGCLERSDFNSFYFGRKWWSQKK